MIVNSQVQSVLAIRTEYSAVFWEKQSLFITRYPYTDMYTQYFPEFFEKRPSQLLGWDRAHELCIAKTELAWWLEAINLGALVSKNM